jgi:ligand-binding sensor domain-containing protein
MCVWSKWVCAILLKFVILCSSQVFATQRNDIVFDHISVEQGLSQVSVFCILQDRKGFMWFGTEDGLNRYDGYTFKTYKYEAGNLRSLGGNVIKARLGAMIFLPSQFA